MEKELSNAAIDSRRLMSVNLMVMLTTAIQEEAKRHSLEVATQMVLEAAFLATVSAAATVSVNTYLQIEHDILRKMLDRALAGTPTTFSRNADGSVTAVAKH